MTLKLGVFTVMLPELTPEEAAKALQESGYTGVEWRMTTLPSEKRNDPPSFWGNNRCTLTPTAEDARRAKALAARYHLATPNLGSYVSVGDLAAAETAMNFAKLAGIPSFRVGVGELRGSYAESFSLAEAFLGEVTTLAQSYGVKALVETHHATICPSAGLTYRLVSRFDPDLIGVIYDPGNMVHEGFEAYALGLELLGPYLAHVHIKNAAYIRPDGGGVWQAHWSPLTDGVVDIQAFLDALQAVGYDGWLVVEDFSTERPVLEALARNFTFLREKLKSRP